ncbi:MAG: SurA N-terminal domain-containing protein [Gammaproteobacteria bacterium]|nr:SurA N-terminal domain-containing protein [Gammaproteobacteria bacterium]
MQKSIKNLMISMACCFACMSAFATQEQTLDKIVAVVNEDVVTKSELSHALDIVKLQGGAAYAQAFQDQNIRQRALEQLINKKLQLQLAKQAGVKITNKDLDEAIKNIAQQNHVSSETLYEKIKQEGIARNVYRDEIREQMMMNRIQRQELMARLTITPKEVDRYMVTLKAERTGPKAYRIVDILVPLADNVTEPDRNLAKTHALQIAASLKQGKPLSTIAGDEKAAGIAVQSEDLGFLHLTELPSAFASVVNKMVARDVSAPIETGNGFHVLQLAEIKQEGSQAILNRKDAQELLLQRKFEEAMQTWLSKLRSQAYIVMKT